jgi:hypothetical protein
MRRVELADLVKGRNYNGAAPVDPETGEISHVMGLLDSPLRESSPASTLDGDVLMGMSVEDLSNLFSTSKGVELFSHHDLRPAELETATRVINQAVDELIKTAQSSHKDHVDALRTALIIRLIPDHEFAAHAPSLKTSLLSDYHLFILSQVVNEAVRSVKPYDSSTPLPAHDHVEVVLTSHPDNSVFPPIARELRTVVERIIKDVDGKSVSPELRGAGFEKLLAMNPIRPKPTLSSEGAIAADSVFAMWDAVPELEMQNGLEPGGLNFGISFWANFEGDRNAVHGPVLPRSTAFFREKAATRHLETLGKMDFDEYGPSVKSKLETLKIGLERSRTNAKEAYKLSEVRMLMEILYAMKASPGRFNTYKFVNDLRNQVAPELDLNQPPKILQEDILELIKERGFDDVSRLKQLAGQNQLDSLAVANIVEGNVSSRLRELLTDPIDIHAFVTDLDKDRRDLQELAQSSGHVEDRLHLEQQEVALFKLESQIRTFQLHLGSGQGRLDTETSIRTAADTLLERHSHRSSFSGEAVDLKSKEYWVQSGDGESLQRSKEAAQSRLYIDAILDPNVAPAEDSSCLDAEERNTFSYFRSAKLLQEVNPRHMDTIIIANDGGVRDFLRTFYLARRAGLIEIDPSSGRVTKSNIIIMPLKESVADHDHAFKAMEALCTIPVVRSYFEEAGIFTYMKAYSDTGRGDGQLAAQARLKTTPTQVMSVADYALRYDLASYCPSSEELVKSGVFKSEGAAAAFRVSPYGLFGGHEQLRYWNAAFQMVKVINSSDVEAPEGLAPMRPVKARVEHGVGSTDLRTGGRGIDETDMHTRPVVERQYKTTLQQAAATDYLSSPGSAKDYLHFFVDSNGVPEDDFERAEDRTEMSFQYIKFFKDLSDPALEAFHREVVEMESELNRRMLETPEAWYGNHHVLGSRGNGGKDFRGKSFTAANRAISSARYWQNIGANLHSIRSSYAAFTTYLKDAEPGENRLEVLQHKFRDKHSFRMIIWKLQQEMLATNFDQAALQFDREYLDQYQHMHAELSKILCLISGSKSLLEDFPHIRSQVWVERSNRYKAAVLRAQQYHVFDPRPETGTPLKSVVPDLDGGNFWETAAQLSSEDQARLRLMALTMKTREG